ncbi:MAG: FHA domain-containing protein, partial [Pseudomonadota bacterium]
SFDGRSAVIWELKFAGQRWKRGLKFITADTDRGVVIGRAPEADLVLPEARVSRRHARLVRDARSAAGFALEDLGSTNGTFLNGARLGTRTPAGLNDGDSIDLGGVIGRLTRA